MARAYESGGKLAGQAILRSAKERINSKQAWEKSAERTGQSLEEVALIFQGVDDSEKYPDLQEDTDILNGLYQIESELIFKLEKKQKSAPRANLSATICAFEFPTGSNGQGHSFVWAGRIW